MQQLYEANQSECTETERFNFKQKLAGSQVRGNTQESSWECHPCVAKLVVVFASTKIQQSSYKHRLSQNVLF